MAIVQGELFTGLATIEDVSDLKFGFFLNDWYQDSRMDYIILSSDLTAIGLGANYNITELRLWLSELSAQNTFTNMRIAIKHTSDTAMATGTFTANGDQYSTFTEVFYASTYPNPTSTGWHPFTFSTPFKWNGTSHIKISLSKDMNTAIDTKGMVTYRVPTGQTRIRFYYADSATAFPFDNGFFGGDGVMQPAFERLPQTYLVADSGTATGTPGTVAYATKQVINRTASTAYATKQVINKTGSIAYATKQAINQTASAAFATKQFIYRIGSVSYATQQTIADGGIPGSVVYSTKQAINQTASTQVATRQSISQAGSASLATKQSIYQPGTLNLATKQIIYQTGLFDVATKQRLFETTSAAFATKQAIFVAGYISYSTHQAITDLFYDQIIMFNIQIQRGLAFGAAIKRSEEFEAVITRTKNFNIRL